MNPVPAAALGLVTAVVVTRLVELVARRRALYDIPNDRSSHALPTPRIGGLGIASGTVVGFLLADGAADRVGGTILAAALLLGVAGLVDDLRHISVPAKYLAQVGTAALAAWAIGPAFNLSFGGTEIVIDGLTAIALATLWLTALINAFNFMDGIDGLIGSVAVIASVVGMALVGAEPSPLLLAVAAASVGFLVWNMAPASVFMGDVGSQFLGLAVGAGMLHQGSGSVEPWPLVLVVAPLLFDTGFTLIRRWREGKNVLAGHREHLYQRLVVAGRSHREVSAGYACATAICGVAALGWAGAPGPVSIGVVAALLLAGIAYANWVARLEARRPA